MFDIVNGKYDVASRESFKKNKATVISWILAASYAYYHRYTSLLNDETFDKMCKWLLDNYDAVEHQHKHLLTKDMLQAGTAFNLKLDDFPAIVKVTSEHMIENLNIWLNTNNLNIG